MMLYALTQEDVTPDARFVTNDGNVILFKTLNLNQDFAAICAQLDSFITY